MLLTADQIPDDLREFFEPAACERCYVCRMVAVFREVWRVLRDDGTVWLNLGDSYATGTGRNDTDDANLARRAAAFGTGAGAGTGPRSFSSMTHPTKPKDLVGVPWRVAFALQTDGWYLRSDIVWSKPNPMPESVSDRPTKAHEYLFLLAKGQRKTRVVQFSDLPSEPLHLGADFRSKRPDLVAGDFCVRLAAAILDRTKVEQQSGLPTLDPEVWQQRVTGMSRAAVGHLPVEHWAAVLSARLLGSEISPKEFLGELERHGVALADRDEFLVADGLPLVALPPGVARYGETAIAIHDAGEIGELDFSSHTVKSSRPSGCSYFYDADAIREAQQDSSIAREARARLTAYAPPGQTPQRRGPKVDASRNDAAPDMAKFTPEAGRNRRSVWTIPTEPFPEAHFATYPQALVRPCIQAGTSEKGECSSCGAPWVREVERTAYEPPVVAAGERNVDESRGDKVRKLSGAEYNRSVRVTGESWRASCVCDAPTRPQTVLDPFVGSGTTALVARNHGRRCIGIDLSESYLTIAAKRLSQLSLLAGAPPG